MKILFLSKLRASLPAMALMNFARVGKIMGVFYRTANCQAYIPVAIVVGVVDQLLFISG
jgi:hypothetical protein